MRRRDFITLLGGAAVGLPLNARAQKPKRIGVLFAGSPDDDDYQASVETFEQVLRTLGWRNGENLHIDYRWSVGNIQRSRANAEEMVQSAPDLIIVGSTAMLALVKPATSTIPIVFTGVSDPVAQGFVTNLSRPGGNITGFTAYEFSIGSKWLDLLKQISPAIRRVALLGNPVTSPQFKYNLARQQVGALLVGVDLFYRARREQIAELAARHAIPAIYERSDFAAAGGLMSYGTSEGAANYQVGIYVARILKGAKPADLPVMQATKFQFVINLKTAKALGVEFPAGLLAIADEVIE